MHTNSTPNYNLPQFVGTDIINPLTDINDAYSTIDTTMKNIADGEATSASAITALQTAVGDSASGLVKAVNDLEAQNGDATLTTSAQTLSGGINEVNTNTNANTQNISINASNITALQNTVGNANSGLVKDVADLQTKVVYTHTFNGTETWNDVLDDISSACDALSNKDFNNSKIVFTSLHGTHLYYPEQKATTHIITYSKIKALAFEIITLAASSPTFRGYTFTIDSETNAVTATTTEYGPLNPLNGEKVEVILN